MISVLAGGGGPEDFIRRWLGAMLLGWLMRVFGRPLMLFVEETASLDKAEVASACQEGARFMTEGQSPTTSIIQTSLSATSMETRYNKYAGGSISHDCASGFSRGA